MKATQLCMKQFRNYEHETVDFTEGVNVIMGENAQGKTNLLEALYLCAALRSFRTRKDRELVMKERDYGYVKLSLLSQQENEAEEARVLEMVFSGDQKKRVKRNGLSQTKISDVMGTFKAVLFSPEDLKIVKDSPSERRSFMDSEIMQVSPKYYHTLLQYQKNMKQRNQLLKRNTYNTDEMAVWEQQLAEHGVQLIKDRHDFLQEMKAYAVKIHQQLTDGKETLSLTYEPGIRLHETWPEEKKQVVVERMRESLERNRVSDQVRQTTGKGPHRDDVSFSINKMDVRLYGSQGQKRTVVLSLKLAVLEWMKKKAGEYPVLLLDDVTSELDDNRQRYLLEYLKPVQTIITTTHLLPGMEREGNIVHVKNGKVEGFGSLSKNPLKGYNEEW